MADFYGTATVAASPVELTMPRPTTDSKVQVVAGGSNSLQLDGHFTNQTAAITLTTLSGEAVILDVRDLQQLDLTASGGDVEYTVTSYGE